MLFSNLDIFYKARGHISMPDALSPRILYPFSRKETQLVFGRTDRIFVVELQSKTIKDLYKQTL